MSLAETPDRHPLNCANPLTRKLSHFAKFTPADEAVLDRLASGEEAFRADVDIVSEGMPPRSVFLVTEGMAIRYRALPDGGRQIMTFLLPGDLCDFHGFLLRRMDHSIASMTEVRIAPVSRERLMDVCAGHPRITAALWWSSMQEEAMLRERIVSLGRRDARGRIAYLLCELFWRHAAIGLVNGKSFCFPLTQKEIGDTLGITAVHVNRILREYRERGLITIKEGKLHLHDVEGLQGIAAFDERYLHLRGPTEIVTRYVDELERRAPPPIASLAAASLTALRRQEHPRASLNVTV